jgi:hypothetical protein
MNIIAIYTRIESISGGEHCILVNCLYGSFMTTMSGLHLFTNSKASPTAGCHMCSVKLGHPSHYNVLVSQSPVPGTRPGVGVY